MITGKGMATTNAVQGKLIRLLSKYSNVFYFYSLLLSLHQLHLLLQKIKLNKYLLYIL